ncbi:MAG: hydrogenase [Deltaproteobacteria bacterium]|nr:hydrogenase [Deltaproteobacteria bacterium]
MITSSFLSLHNARAVPLAHIPLLTLLELQQAIVTAANRNRRVVCLFTTYIDNTLELWVILASDIDGILEVARAPLSDDGFASIATQCPEIQLFEREIAEQYGLNIIGHPLPKPVRFHTSWREGHVAWGHTTSANIGVMDYYQVDGHEVHEVAVGPVHAGVIEPGHFRFQCHGEQVFHLEISLGYQHRGIEQALLQGPNLRSIHYMETLAGDTSIGHTNAYCQAVESLSGSSISARAHVLRAIALELERLANHTGDLGALAHDVGYLPTASYCGRLRGDFLNLTALLCGSRFGRGIVRPGGVTFDLEPIRAVEFITRLDAIYRDVKEAVRLLWTTTSVQARFEDTGRLSTDLARNLGLVGLAARACGLQRDVRKNHPAGIYQFVHIPISTWHSGDVFARAFLRWLEIERAVKFIRDQVHELPHGDIQITPAPLQSKHLCVSLVEGWRGEICHVAITDGHGRFSAYKVVDPSFHNWIGLAMALRNQPISDFPLCNKSFNLSYCGHDL